MKFCTACRSVVRFELCNLGLILHVYKCQPVPLPVPALLSFFERVTACGHPSLEGA